MASCSGVPFQARALADRQDCCDAQSAEWCVRVLQEESFAVQCRASVGVQRLCSKDCSLCWRSSEQWNRGLRSECESGTARVCGKGIHTASSKTKSTKTTRWQARRRLRDAEPGCAQKRSVEIAAAYPSSQCLPVQHAKAQSSSTKRTKLTRARQKL